MLCVQQENWNRTDWNEQKLDHEVGGHQDKECGASIHLWRGMRSQKWESHLKAVSMPTKPTYLYDLPTWLCLEIGAPKKIDAKKDASHFPIFSPFKRPCVGF